MMPGGGGANGDGNIGARYIILSNGAHTIGEAAS